MRPDDGERGPASGPPGASWSDRRDRPHRSFGLIPSGIATGVAAAKLQRPNRVVDIG